MQRMTRLRRRLPWLALLATAVLGAAVARAAHVHEPEFAGGPAHVHCDLCLASNSPSAPPPATQALWQSLQPTLAPAPEPAQAIPLTAPLTAHRPRGPPLD
jgi:hypothetical protein